MVFLQTILVVVAFYDKGCNNVFLTKVLDKSDVTSDSEVVDVVTTEYYDQDGQRKRHTQETPLNVLYENAEPLEK